ncbi:alpha/beta hydrolase [Vulcanisaeta thermophila]|uniref:alpha/beta hydrolase n=1 Tax=Vulcanisaeta thermophila TaxID=867917 RepID=UPI000852A4CB|nr:alpha/beta hydrolase [Vulcanisaeta thermophila]
MPLDPKLRELIEQITKLTPKLTEQTLETYRKAFKQFFKSVAPTVPVYKTEDVVIEGTEARIPARVYYPSSERNRGVLVYFHGGGFVLGDVETYDPLCRALTNACNCVVVSVDYRLAPEHKFPAAVVDSIDATKWVLRNAEKINGDPNKVAIGGDSAGGNLAAVVAITARNEGWKPGIKYQVLINPFLGVDFSSYSQREYATGYFLEGDQMDFFGRAYLRSPADAFDWRFSPIMVNDLRNLPPALIITSEYDPLRDHAETYAARLKAAGVPTVSVRFNFVTHGFYGFPINEAQAAIVLIGGVLRLVFYGT